MYESRYLANPLSNKKNKFISVLLGALTCSNYIYLFAIGNSSTMQPINLLIIILSFYYLITDRKKYVHILSRVFAGFLPIFLFIIFSGLIVAVDHTKDFRAFFVGMLFLLLNVNAIAITIQANDIKGVLLGFRIAIILNIAYAILSYLLYLVGINLTFLAETFFRSGVFMVTSWSGFRTTGLFLEPGHMVRYFACVLPLVIFDETKGLRWFVATGSIVACTMAKSASLIVLFVALIALLVLKRKKSMRRVRVRTVLSVTITIIVIMLVVALLPDTIKREITQYLSDSLSDASTTSTVSGNSYRFERMQLGLELSKRYPIFGCGYNTTQYLMPRLYGSTVFGIYSYFITLLAEIGIGCVFYMYWLVRLANRERKCAKQKDISAALTVSFLAIIMESAITDLAFQPFIAIIMGISVLNRRGPQNVVQKYNQCE